ncbi:MAG: MerR family DNA-binding transcriptional regulator [Aliishimia sp.]
MLKIGELAKRVNVSVDTLRLYERRGLIKSERMANGYRVFDTDMERIVNLVRQGQRLGFTLKDMAEISSALSQNDLPAEKMAELLQSKLLEVDHKLSELSELRHLLETMRSQACPLRKQI